MALNLHKESSQEMAGERARQGVAACLETLVAALTTRSWRRSVKPVTGSIRVGGAGSAFRRTFVPQRIAHHIAELVEREERPGEFRPAVGR